MHHRQRNAHSPSHALCVNTASVRAQPQLVCVSSFGFPHNVCRRLVFCYLPGIELHPVFVVYGYSHRTVQTSSESKPGAMAQVLSRASRMAKFCWREPQHRTWLALGMSESNPSAALALYSLLGPRATVASVQSGRSDAIVTQGTVPAEWPFCWQLVRAARPAQHRTWRPLPWACPSRALVVFTLLGIRGRP